ncbi:MAG: ATP-dependent helicase [Alphaproteobacteria bacterium]|tara:strand:- start:5025 stop:7172 length:2148 start_codon:yes stop_codon:yes gene_type:complete
MNFKKNKISIPEPDFVTNLNEQQRIAVSETNGPLLVLSGAGTGKTKVLTTRLANLIYKRLAKTNEILAVTFTNKAALEMKQRVEKILNIPVEGMFIGTFHSIGVRFLRKHSNLVNLKNDFTILDTSDQLRLLKQVISFLNLDEKRYVPKNFLYMIDQAKNLGLLPEDINNHEFEVKTDGKFGMIYKAYQERLKNFNSVDFGDLITLPVKLFKKNPEIQNFYQKKFKYILVDEYQDTNGAQYMLLRLLTGEKRNICCVGDEDQSIYGWRGAQLKNILNFDRDFVDAKIIRLEQNYRSTGNILKTASSLISENEERIGKDLWTSDSNGEPVKILNLENDEAEALYIAREIRNLDRNKVKLSDIAILTRASFQFKDIEDRFLKEGIKYRVVGGLRFYERAEIKDALSYFRLLINKSDNLAFERIINTPKRGMGKVFIQRLYEFSNEENTSLYEALDRLVDLKDMKNQQLSKSKQFLQILNNHSKMLEKDDHSDVAGSLLEEVGYIEMLQADKTPEADGKLENLKKLVSDIKNRNSIYEFLEEVSLLTDILSNSDGLEKISLMTLHSAKGLEFNYVFLPGWEEGIFPNQRSLDENGNKGLEEERRLGYVGITRARKNLYISYVNFRKQYNYSIYRSIPSRFLSELPDDNCKVLKISTKEKVDKQKLSSLVNTKFDIGDKVSHDQFGKGLVLGIYDDQLHIRFENDDKITKIFSDYVKKL